MHKNATKCDKTQSKWCINKHGASKIIDTFETYQLGQASSLFAKNTDPTKLPGSIFRPKFDPRAWLDRAMLSMARSARR
jgi:hypothetical protein